MCVDAAAVGLFVLVERIAAGLLGRDHFQGGVGRIVTLGLALLASAL